MARELERTQALLGLLAQREARLQVALQLEGLTLEAQELRVRELLADLSTPEQPAPQREPLWPEATELPEERAPVAELQLPRRPEPEELEPMPPAEDQLWSQLGGPSSTRMSAPSSES